MEFQFFVELITKEDGIEMCKILSENNYSCKTLKGSLYKEREDLQCVYGEGARFFYGIPFSCNDKICIVSSDLGYDYPQNTVLYIPDVYNTGKVVSVSELRDFFNRIDLQKLRGICITV